MIYNTVTHSIRDLQEQQNSRTKFIEIIKRLPYQGNGGNDDIVDLSSAVNKVGDLFFGQQKDQLVDGNVLIVYITGSDLEQQMRSEPLTTLLQQYTTDKGLELVFVVSGRLGPGTRDMVQKMVGSPHRLIFMKNDEDSEGDKFGEPANAKNIDSILPNTILLKGNTKLPCTHSYLECLILFVGFYFSRISFFLDIK